MPLRLLQHPLADHILTHLRDRTTKPVLFRNLSYQFSLMLALEATRDLETVEKNIETPLAPHTGRVLARSLVVVPILRAGLGMLQPFQDIFPDTSVGYIGLERDHETAKARSYYCKLPPVADTRTIVVDPMLATGGSASQALQLVKDNGATDVCLVCILGSPEGVETIHRAHPDVSIILGVLDESLDANKYIVPGLGDFGDRLYGTHA
jgi:uracil phosphoribosyltransferase